MPPTDTLKPRLRLLIADDQDYIRRGLRTLVNREFEVCGEAVDGKDAITKAVELRPDVVLMDVGMPGINGLDATEEIRRTAPSVRVVTVSQYELPEIVRASLSAGATAHVSKLNIWAELIPILQRLQRSVST